MTESLQKQIVKTVQQLGWTPQQLGEFLRANYNVAVPCELTDKQLVTLLKQLRLFKRVGANSQEAVIAGDLDKRYKRVFEELKNQEVIIKTDPYTLFHLSGAIACAINLKQLPKKEAENLISFYSAITAALSEVDPRLAELFKELDAKGRKLYERN